METASGPMRGTVHWVNQDGKLVNDEKLSRFEREDPNGALRLENGNGPLRYVPVYEDDMSIPIDSSEKYRIPYTSVVNKVGDCKLFFCCGWRLTAAQVRRRIPARSELTRVSVLRGAPDDGLRHLPLCLLAARAEHARPRPRRPHDGADPPHFDDPDAADDRAESTSWGPGWNNSLGRTEFYIKDNHQAVRPNVALRVTRAVLRRGVRGRSITPPSSPSSSPSRPSSTCRR